MTRKERHSRSLREQPGLSGGIPFHPGSAAMAFADAVRRYEAGELATAEAQCRAVLLRHPDHPGALHLLGTLAHRSQRFEEAAACFRRLAAAAPKLAVAQSGLGTALAALGRLAEAAEAFERALELGSGTAGQPPIDEAATALNLGYLYEQLGQPERAVALYRRAVAANPDFAQAHNNLGVLLLSQGDRREASLAFARALAAAPELFAQFDQIKSMLLRLHPAVAEAIERTERAWPAPLSADDILSRETIGAIIDDPLLLFILEATPVADMSLEKVLTSARAALLVRAESGAPEAADDLVTFACALAQQCFINQYVYCESRQERDRIERLKRVLIAALAEGTSVAPLVVAAVACYEPLAGLPDGQRLLERQWPEAVARLLTRQIREVQTEQMLRASMPQLTPISGEASARVRAQYEANPYPRWVLPPSKPAPVSINHFLFAQFPGRPIRPIDDSKGLDILIAGCGTGHHPIGMARRYAGARVLAIDLSLASLAYAARKSSELGVANIEYGQADILALASLGRSFDVVDASGVLHHLADPLEGWRRLCELTRPGGVMRIGLYSALGRAEVVAARSFIAERGFRPEIADIRRCRHELMATPMRGLAHYQDFYSVSECRDLMFHVEEHRLDLPQIKAFLAAHNLTLLGFEVSADTARAYRARHPNDPTMTDLDGWAAFEAERPATFAGMYQFWCQK